jgi:hypothetical protein
VDGHLHHDHQKRDLQVSRKGVVDSCKGDKIGKEGSKGGSAKRTASLEVLVRIHIFVSHMYLQLINVVFRL